jgi:serine/threonine protein kinase
MTESHSNDVDCDHQFDDAFWEIIADKVDLLVAAWDRHASHGPPVLRDLLGDLAEHHVRPVLCELIKIDLEYRWQDGRAPQALEAYVRQLPELGGVAELPVDVIYEELKIRGQYGDAVPLHELPGRFPHQADALRGLLGTLRPPGLGTVTGTSTTIASGASPDNKPDVSLDQLQSGDSIDDFDLLLLLGSGSFARVYLARQRSLERLVALKISQSVSTEPRTLAQLDHPNIVRVFDERSCCVPPVRLLYMELVAGGTLQDVIRRIREEDWAERRGHMVLEVVDEHLAQSGMAPPDGSLIRSTYARVDWPTAICHLGAHLSEGLAYAHEKGVLHRDIKPANVLLTPEGSPKLADFNVSYQGGRAGENPADTFGGSLGYMSPEQLAACHPALGGSPMQVREASDLYSLGVVLWELVTGKRPFSEVPRGDGWGAMLQRMIDERKRWDPTPMAAQLADHCSQPLQQVLVRCLQPEPQDRFRSAKQLADSLRLCLNPRCWQLLQEPTGGLRQVPLRWPVTTALMLTLLPSIFAAIFNLFYNRAQIIEYLDGAERTFDFVQAVINATAFPLGITLTICTARRAASSVQAAVPADPSAGGTAVLLLGRDMARIALALWLISGLAYPVSLHFGVPHAITLGVYVHFAISLALCGILAGTYPFFFVTFIGIRYLLPALIRREIIRGPRLEDLCRLRRLNRLFLVLTAFVPLLGILLILLYSPESGRNLATARLWLIIASVTGLVGFGAMFWLHREIDEDLVALRSISPDKEDLESNWG